MGNAEKRNLLFCGAIAMDCEGYASGKSSALSSEGTPTELPSRVSGLMS